MARWPWRGFRLQLVAGTERVREWPFDIIGQQDWDAWVLVCVAAALVLVGHAAVSRPWRTGRGLLVAPLILAGVGGAVLVVAVPALHDRFVGMFWTLGTLVLVSLTFYLNLWPRLGAGRIAVLVGLRSVALAMLVTMLFDPIVRWTAKPAPERALIFVIDASGSMSFPDVQNGPTRFQSVWRVLEPELGRVRESFVPQFYTFSTGLDELKDPDDLASLQPAGKATDIVAAMNAAGAKARTGARAAFVLISDGIDNASPSVAGALRYFSFPIYTVLVGSEQAEGATMANVAVTNVEASDDFVVGHETVVRATVKSSALSGRVVDVRMAPVDSAGKPLGEARAEKLVLQPAAEGQAVELKYTPRGTGVHRLAVWVDPVPGERSTADNRQEFQGLALDPRIKVLYVEGRVRPEYTQLNRALARDPNVEVATLLRIQQDRFTAGGTVDGRRFTKMPQTYDEWRTFDVILIGDLDASFLTRMQQESIEKHVSEGGGLMMIGGQNSFGPGAYEGTPIERALPVFVGPVSAGQERSEFVPRLTAEGATHPATDGLAEWFGVEQKKGEKAIPALRGNVVVPKAKSGAQVLAVHAERPAPEDSAPQIVLAVQRYGKGRSAAFTVDTTYLWYLPMRAMGQDSPYNRIWGQLIRWLAGEDATNRQRGAGVDGLLNKSLFQLGESVKVRAMVRDERGDATRFAQVNLTLRRGGSSEAKQVPLPASEGRTGMYEVVIPTPEKGEYSAELSATKDGKSLGKQPLTFTVIPPAEEMLKLAADRKGMAELATATRGRAYTLDELPKLISDLTPPPAIDPEASVRSVRLSNWVRAGMALAGKPPTWEKAYDLPMQGALVLGLLGIEWALRRRWQLP